VIRKVITCGQIIDPVSQRHRVFRAPTANVMTMVRLVLALSQRIAQGFRLENNCLHLHKVSRGSF
jgi:hypothetical protein